MPKKPEELIRDEVRSLTAYHVPDSAGMVKLDAMENPYPLPESVRTEVADLVARADVNRYPDASCAALKARLRAVLGVPAEMSLVLGNGSDEIIQMLMLATARPGSVVLGVEPSFVMFRLIASFCGMRYVGVPLAGDFSLDERRMADAIAAHAPALVFIAYPNNPTGNLFDDRAIERIVNIAPGAVVIDEAYHAFAGRTYMNRLGDFENLLVMRTLSKSGLAGLRLGILAGRSAWLDHIDKVRLPYNVGVLTQLVAGKALERHDLLAEQAAAIRAERARVSQALECIPGVTPFPSEANFILFRVTGAEALFGGLKQRGVLIKNLHGSQPALENCLRVTVGTPRENDRFLAALRETMK
jgi:histidinol-phosphate aminotransferase